MNGLNNWSFNLSDNLQQSTYKLSESYSLLLYIQTLKTAQV